MEEQSLSITSWHWSGSTTSATGREDPESARAPSARFFIELKRLLRAPGGLNVIEAPGAGVITAEKNMYEWTLLRAREAREPPRTPGAATMPTSSRPSSGSW